MRWPRPTWAPLGLKPDPHAVRSSQALSLPPHPHLLQSGGGISAPGIPIPAEQDPPPQASPVPAFCPGPGPVWAALALALLIAQGAWMVAVQAALAWGASGPGGREAEQVGPPPRVQRPGRAPPAAPLPPTVQEETHTAVP